MIGGLLFSLLGCGRPSAVIDCAQLTAAGSQDALGGNILLILSDDIGIDKTAAYDAHPAPARTPNLDELACAGVRFDNAYSNPVCSPSRSALLTGRHGSRTGIGRWINTRSDTFDLVAAEVTIPELLAESTQDYTSAAVGKWHLTSFERDEALAHPNLQGFSHYAGSLGNPTAATQPSSKERGYRYWEKVTNGSVAWETTYMSTDTTNDAIEQLQSLPEPWFLYASFNGAHTPLHVPPRSLTSTATSALSSDVKKYNAMVEATDAEIGRMLASIPSDVLARTTIIYLSDNGTPSHAIEPPWESSWGKGSLHESGINVPMIVTGPLVSEPGRSSAALVSLVDVFPTVAEIAQVPLGSPARDSPFAGLSLDGVSFLSHLQDPDAAAVRATAYAEKFHPNGTANPDYHHRMITDGQWKLIRKDSGTSSREELYLLESLGSDGEDRIDSLSTDPAGAAAYEQLSLALDAQIEEMIFEH